jgi:lysophospholipase L1-like esterase
MAWKKKHNIKNDANYLDPEVRDLKVKQEETSVQLAQTVNGQKHISKTLNKMINGEVVKVVCYGDSITFGYKPVDPNRGSQVANPYPKVLQERLRNVFNNTNITVVNRGTSGWQTDEAVANFSTKVLAENPDLVIMMFGINDCRGNSTYGNPVLLPEYRKNLQSMVYDAKNNGIEVTLMSSNPILDSGNNNHKKLGSYAKAMGEVSVAHSTAFVDLHAELTKLFFSKKEAPFKIFLDNIHFADDKYALIADILVGRLFFAERDLLYIESTKEQHVPIYKSPYVSTDSTLAFTNDGQFYGVNDYFKKDGTGGTFMKFHFFVTVPGVKLTVGSPRNPGGGKITALHNGTALKTVDYYSEESHVFEAETTLIEELDVGFHTIEFKNSSMLQGQSSDSNPNAYFTEFVFKRKTEQKYHNYVVASGATLGTIEHFKKINDGKVRFTSANSAKGTGMLFSEKDYVELAEGKTTVIEAEGSFMDASGISWFGNFAKSPSGANIAQANTGYLVYLRGGAVTLFRFGLNNSLTSLNVYTTSVNFANKHKIRIEHTYAGNIKVFLNGSEIINITDTKHYGGYLGLYAYNPGTIEIDRLEYCQR